MRIGRLVSVSLVAGLLAAGACKKDSKKDGEAKEGAAAGDKAGETAAAGGEAAKPAEQPADTTATAAAGERPASVTPEMAALAEKMIVHMEAIAAAGDENQADCSKAAAAMKEKMEAARPDIEKMEAMQEQTKGDKAGEEWFKKTYESRMMAAMGKLMNISQKCADNPDFKKAMEESPFGGKK